ncbi:MFS transporter [Streptomyces sp. NPDC005708]|uniref:MFS transporter n=1 Tax=Streptomyces sp. NPDC005708 TaxID=3154564 RepID=UPI003404DF81
MNRNYRLTFAVLAAGVGVFAMLQSLVATVLPAIQHALHTSQANAAWVMTAHLLSASVFTPILGRIGDLVGKKHTLVATLAVLAVGSVLAALAPNVSVLIFARVLQGVGGASFPLAFGIIRDEFPADRISSGISSVSAVIAVGAGIGVIAAGPLMDALGFRFLFWLPAAVVVVTALIAARYIPESPQRSKGRVNWTGAVLLSGWLVALMLPLSQAVSWGWGSARVLGLLAAAVVLFTAWITVEARSASPLIDLKVMRLPGVWTTNAVALLFGAGQYAVLVFLPAFVQTPSTAGYGFGASVTVTGLLMLPMVVAQFLVGVISARITPRVGAKALLAAGAALLAVSYAMLAAWHGQQWQVAAASAVFGLSVGVAYPAMATLIVHNVPAAQTGAATGMNANIRTIGGSIGIALTTGLITGSLQPSGLPRAAGYTHGFALLAALTAAATLVSLLIPKTRSQATVTDTVSVEPVTAPASR